MKGQDVLFSSGKDGWRTPPHLFLNLHAEFGFDIDLAADEESALCAVWCGPGSPTPDALTAVWRRGTTGFLNPPYSLVKRFVAKAASEQAHDITTVLLVPARTDTRWWHAYVWDVDQHQPRPDVSVRLLKGRLRFIDPASPLTTPGPAPFPSAVLVFRPHRSA